MVQKSDFLLNLIVTKIIQWVSQHPFVGYTALTCSEAEILICIRLWLLF